MTVTDNSVEVFNAGDHEPDTTNDADGIVLEARLTTARAQVMQAKRQELREAYTVAKILTNSTSINKEFQATHRPRVYKGGRWVEEEPLGDQAVYNLMVAIVYGAKLGWDDPIECAMRIFSIHGKPAIEAKDALGFIRTYIDKRIASGQSKPAEGGDDIWEVEADQDRVVWASRRNGREASVEWTMDRARSAGYTARKKPDEPSKYETNPIEMLRWKCVMELARIQWSDVLRGIQYSKEELELEQAASVRVEQVPVRRPAQETRGIEGARAMRAHRAAMTAGAPPAREEPATEPKPQPAAPEQDSPEKRPQNVNEDPDEARQWDAVEAARDAAQTEPGAEPPDQPRRGKH